MELTGTSAAATVDFLGVRFDRIDRDEACARVLATAGSARFSYLVTPNVDHLVMLLASGDEPWRCQYRRAVAGAALRVNDSRVLSRLARLSGLNLPPVPGSDLTRRLIDRLAGSAIRVVLIGGRKAEADWLSQRLPHAAVRHCEPPMGLRDDAAAQQAIVDFVITHDADIVLLAMGAPQSELVAARIAGYGGARGIALCVGASIEFLSGAQRRAPRWVQRAGCEWAYRLLREPRRLWRRYLVDGPRIFRYWLRWLRCPDDIDRRLMSPKP